MSKQQNRSGRPDDECWQYVDKIDEKRWTCKYCSKSFRGSITRVKAHLAGIRGQQICVCRGEVPDDVKRAASQGLYNPPQGGSRHVEPTRQVQPSMHPDRERDNRTCETTALAGAKRFQANEVSSSCNTSTADFIERLLEQPLYSDNLVGLNTDTLGLEMNNNQTFEACNKTIPTEDVEEQLQSRESPSRKKRRIEDMAESMDHREFTHESTGTAAGMANPASEGNPPRARAQTNPNPSAFIHIKGLINMTGPVKGDGNGVFNLGTVVVASAAADRGTSTPPPTQPDPNIQQKGEIIVKILETVNSSGVGQSELATAQSSSSGLINMTNYTEGNANGMLNAGELRLYKE